MRNLLLNLTAAAATGVLIVGILYAQATDPPPRFEAAEIHVSANATNPATWASGDVLRGGRYELRKTTMLDLIKTAWNVDPDTVFGGPNWLELDRFDIAAKAPPRTSPETLHLMLQALLKDRFGLAVHEDTRPGPAFALTIGKNKPKLTKSDGSGTGSCEYQQQASAAAHSVIYSCRNMSMDDFASWLKQVGDYLTLPITNQTGLEGAWDFDLKWNFRSQVLPPDSTRITIFDAVSQQLGLALELKTAPAPVLVVDRVNEKPAPDPPGTDKAMPPRNDQFEVADFKISYPGEVTKNHLTSTHFEAQATVFKTFIAYAFDVDGHPDDLVVGIPKGIEMKQFDFNGKLAADSSDKQVYTGGTQVYRDDDLRLMVRNLLIERFKIKYHYEDRPVSAYSLVSSKPKMKKADPSHRSSCKNAQVVENDPRDSNPLLNRLITCQNVTMAQFAAFLHGLNIDYFAVPVEDATGIEGAYDFTLSFSNSYFLNNPTGGDGAATSDPSGALSLIDAVNKQLGLKLEKRRRMVPVLVIDHMEEKPEQN